MWIDHMSSVCPDVPIMVNRVTELRDTLGLVPGGMIPFTIEVGISFKVAKKGKVPCGRVPKMTPDEELDAVLMLIAEDLKVHPENAAAWAKTMRTAPMDWRIMGTADTRYFNSLKVRNMAVQRAKALKLNVVQIVYDIWGSKCEKRRSSNALFRLPN